MIAENELAGAQTPTPWTPNNAQYRAERPRLPHRPAGPRARRRCSRSRTRRTRAATPPTGGSRSRRSRSSSARSTSPRRTRSASTQLGPARGERLDAAEPAQPRQPPDADRDPSGRVALQMQLTTSPGPRPARRPPASQAWFEIVKLEALAAKFVATQFKLAGRLVVGLGDASTRTRRPTPTSPPRPASGSGRATRRSATAPPPPAPASTPPSTEGQLDVPAGARCLHERRARSRATPSARFTTLTGDPGYAASVLLEQLALPRRAAGRSADLALRGARRDRRRLRRRPHAATGTPCGGEADARRRARDHRRAPRSATRSRRASARRRRPPPRSPTSSRPTANQQARLVRDDGRRRPGSAAPRRAGWSRPSRPPSSSRSPARRRSTPPTARSQVTPLGPVAPARPPPARRRLARPRRRRSAASRATQIYRSWLRGQEKRRSRHRVVPERPGADDRARPTSRRSCRSCSRASTACAHAGA